MLKFLFSVLLFFCFFLPVSADISISPLKYEVSIEKGSSDVKTIKIRNDGDAAVTLYSSKEDFVAGDDTGFPRFIKPEDLPNPELSLTHWVELENENITLAPGETKEIRFSINVPETSEPGGHYGVIFFGPEAEAGAQVSVIQRLGLLLLVDVPGEVDVKGEFTELTNGIRVDGEFVEQQSFEEFPIVFSSMFHNAGNIHLKPKGKIELVDEDGNTLKKVGKEKIISSAGAFVGERVVDYIPVNESGGNALPYSNRRFISNWEGFGYTVLNEETGEKEVKFKNLTEYYLDKVNEEQKFIKFYETIKTKTVTKPITANYYLYFDGKDNKRQEYRTSNVFYVSYEENYIGINLIFVIAILLILAGGGYYFVVVRPKKMSQTEDALRKKIMDEMKNNS